MTNTVFTWSNGTDTQTTSSSDTAITSSSYTSPGGGYNLVSVVFGSIVTSVTGFINTTTLTSIVFDNSTASLGDFCFQGCSNLSTVTLGNSITSLGSGCFLVCTSLSSIIIPSTVTSLGTSCFQSCSILTSINILSSITTLPTNFLLSCSALVSFTIPSSVTSIGTRCFTSCSHLASITIPPNVTSLGLSCFYDCVALTSVTLGSLITSFGNYCFYNCSSLTSIIIPSSITTIGNNCFSNSSSLTSINLESQQQMTNDTLIGTTIFNACSALTLTVNGYTAPDTAGFTKLIGQLPSSSSVIRNSPASCFQKGVKILCSNGLIPIENLRVNDSVKTYKHGFRKITHIGFNYGINCSGKNSTFNNMFICNTNPDFIITGGHGILLDKNEIYEKILNNHGVKIQDITHIDDKMLMPIGICPGFTEFPPGYSFTYYHFVLENDGNDDTRYGVYATDQLVLTETPSKKQFLLHDYILVI
jgi:hypothetical protein